MKKTLITLVAVVISAVSALAIDLTEAWQTYASNPKMMTAQAPKAKAEKIGFNNYSVALNTAPKSADIKAAKAVATNINNTYKTAESSANDVDVSIFMQPADTTGKLFNLMFVITSDNGESSALIVVYGNASADNLGTVIKNFSIEDVIGS